MKIDLVEEIERPAGDRAEVDPAPSAEAKPLRIGEVLRMHNLITEPQLMDALEESKRLGIRLGQALIRMNILSQDQINWALARHLDIPYLMLNNEMIDPALVRSVPEESQRLFGFVPLVLLENALTVVMSDPTDQRALDAVRQLSGARIKVAIAQPAAIDAALDHVFSQPGADRGTTAEIPRLALHLSMACKEGADELQFHPQAKDVLVTYVRDGEALRQSRESSVGYPAILTQLKGQAQLVEPLDPWSTGSFLSLVEGEERQVRFALFPSRGEPSLLLTIQGAATAPRLSSLGLTSHLAERLTLLLRRRRGLVVVAGLEVRRTIQHLYALLGEAAPRAGERLITVERTNEIHLPTAYQVSLEQLPVPDYEQVLDRVRACSPGILLVDSISELGDAARARLIRTAVGGTLVLVGVEAGDTTEALALLAELCPSSPLLGSALLFVLAQTQLRRLCPHCRRSYGASDALCRLARLTPATGGAAPVELYAAPGCPRCNNTGYAGTVVLHALLEGSSALAHALVEGGGRLAPGAPEEASASDVTLHALASELARRGEISADEMLQRIG